MSNLENLHLILHLPHGEPSLDIAEEVILDDEGAFMIAGGFRAWPYKTWRLSHLPSAEALSSALSEAPPKGWRWLWLSADNPLVRGECVNPRPAPVTGASLLASLGLGKKKTVEIKL